LKLDNYTRIENAPEERKKIIAFLVCGCYTYNY